MLTSFANIIIPPTPFLVVLSTANANINKSMNQRMVNKLVIRM